MDYLRLELFDLLQAVLEVKPPYILQVRCPTENNSFEVFSTQLLISVFALHQAT